MKQLIELCAIDKSNIVHNYGKTIERIVRDIDYMILCDGMQYGLLTYKGVEHGICRPRDTAGNGYGAWQLIVGKVGE